MRSSPFLRNLTNLRLLGLLAAGLAISVAAGTEAAVRPVAGYQAGTEVPALCDSAEFIADVTVPDNAVLQPGTPFAKIWRLQNNGTCTWTTSYALVFVAGEQMGAPGAVSLPSSVAPGQTIDVTVDMVAPSSSGHHRGDWALRNASGFVFGITTNANRPFWVAFCVSAPCEAPPAPEIVLPSLPPPEATLPEATESATLPAPGTASPEERPAVTQPAPEAAPPVETEAPVQAAPPRQLRDIVSLSLGSDSSYALTASGDLWGWGSLCAESQNVLTPELMVGVHDAGAVSAAARGHHVCLLTRSGAVRCWGSNDSGEIGDGTTDSTCQPQDVAGLSSGVAAIGAGVDHSCAVMEDGSVRCWGGNAQGQLGDGTTESRLTPVQVIGISDAIAVAAGGEFTCALIRRDGVMCWGAGGRLGDGSDQLSPSPVNVAGLGSGVSAISAGTSHACALTTTGGVMCWGDWGSGGLGVSETWVSGVTPTHVVGLTSGVVAIAAGGSHTCAILAGGGMRCWGGNADGNVGDGTNDDRLLPVEVVGIEGGAALVAAGGAHTCAVVGDQRMCWGANGSGQLGDGTTIDRWGPLGVRFRVPQALTPEITTYIPTPMDVSTSPGVVGANLFLAGLMMLPFAVAAESFSRTLAENEDFLRRVLRPLNRFKRFQGRSPGTAARGPGRHASLREAGRLLGVVMFYGLVFSLLDRTWNPLTWKGLLLFLYMAIAYGIVGVADDIVQWRSIRKWGLSAELMVRPTNILLAIASTATTRIFSLVPGLMFGTPEALRADEAALDQDQRDRLLRISALTFTILSLGIWIPTIGTNLLLRRPLPDAVSALFGSLQAFLLIVFAVSLENLFVQMLGFSGGFGRALKRRNRWLWLAALVSVAFLFFHTLINPRSELAEALQEGNVLVFLSVAAPFVAVAFLLRVAFRLRKRPTAPDQVAPTGS